MPSHQGGKFDRGVVLGSAPDLLIREQLSSLFRPSRHFAQSAVSVVERVGITETGCGRFVVSLTCCSVAWAFDADGAMTTPYVSGMLSISGVLNRSIRIINCGSMPK
jgi:hypothetical protein